MPITSQEFPRSALICHWQYAYVCLVCSKLKLEWRPVQQSCRFLLCKLCAFLKLVFPQASHLSTHFKENLKYCCSKRDLFNNDQLTAGFEPMTSQFAAALQPQPQLLERDKEPKYWIFYFYRNCLIERKGSGSHQNKIVFGQSEKFVCFLSHSLTRTHTQTHTLKQSHAHRLSYTHEHRHSLEHAHTHYLTCTHEQSHTLSLFFTLLFFNYEVLDGSLHLTYVLIKRHLLAPETNGSVSPSAKERRKSFTGGQRHKNV